MASKRIKDLPGVIDQLNSSDWMAADQWSTNETKKINAEGIKKGLPNATASEKGLMPPQVMTHFDESDSYKLKGSGLKNNSVTGDKIADANVSLAKLTQALIDYINSAGGGSITNNPDDNTLETFSSQIRIKDGGVTVDKLNSVVQTKFTVLEQNTQYQWYVDSENGDDNNNGKSPAAPFQTLSKIQTLYNSGNLPAHSTIYLKSGSYFRDTLILGNNYSIEAYGGGRMPVISGGVVIPTWTLHSGTTYKHTFTGLITFANRITAFENGEFLTRVASVDDCIATVGSYVVFDDTAGVVRNAVTEIGVGQQGNQFTVYINPGSDPNSNGKEYEVVKRGTVVAVDNNCLIRGIHTTKNGMNDGSLVVHDNCIIDDCIASYGTKHNVFTGGNCIVRDSIAFLNEKPHISGASTLFVTFRTSGSGMYYKYENCKAVMTGAAVGFWSHTGGSDAFEKAVFLNCRTESTTYFEGASGIGANEVKNIVCYGCSGFNVPFPFPGGVSTYTENLYLINCFFIDRNDEDTFINPAAKNVYIYNNTFIVYRTHGWGLINLASGSTEKVEVINNTFIHSGQSITTRNQPIRCTGNPVLSFRNNLIYNYKRIDFTGLSSIDADDNIYYASGTPELYFNGNLYNSFANFIAATGEDGNSSTSDPMITSNIWSGEIILDKASPAVSLNSGIT